MIADRRTRLYTLKSRVGWLKITGVQALNLRRLLTGNRPLTTTYFANLRAYRRTISWK